MLDEDILQEHGFNLSLLDYNDNLTASNISSMFLFDLEFEWIISILHAYVLPVIIIIGILGNTVSFLVYIGTPRLCRQSSSVYLAFLAAVDNVFLVTLFVVWFSWVGIHILQKNGWCQVILYSVYVCSFLSVWTVVSFTFERWIVVFHPLRRHKLCTRKRAIVTMSALTVGALAFYSFSIFTTKVSYIRGIPVCAHIPEYDGLLQVMRSIDTMITVIIPSVTIIIMNTGIGIRTCRYAKRTTPLPADSMDELSNFSSIAPRNSGTTRQLQTQCSTTSLASHNSRLAFGVNQVKGQSRWRFFTRRQQTQLRITRALLVVSSVFVLLNLPSYAFRIHAFIISIRNESYELSLHAYIWQEFIQFLYYTNFASNFFLYCACSRNFRFALKRLICRVRRRLGKLKIITKKSRLHRMADPRVG